MIVSDEQLEACCKAHYAVFFPGTPWETLDDIAKFARRDCMRAALAAIPVAVLPNRLELAHGLRKAMGYPDTTLDWGKLARAALTLLKQPGQHDWQHTGSDFIGPTRHGHSYRCRKCSAEREIEGPEPNAEVAADLLDPDGCAPAPDLLATKADEADVTLLNMDVATIWNAFLFFLREVQENPCAGAARLTLARFEELTAGKAQPAQGGG